MRRRDFITSLGSTAATWPISVRAQKQSNRIRRIGVLMGNTQQQSQDDAGLKTVLDRLERFGWKQGLTATIDILWSNSDVALMRKNAQALMELSAALLFSFKDCDLNLICEDREMTREPIKYLALGSVRC